MTISSRDRKTEREDTGSEQSEAERVIVSSTCFSCTCPLSWLPPPPLAGKSDPTAACLYQVVNDAREGIVVLTTDLRIQVWNQAVEKISGVPASEVVGKRPHELFPSVLNAGMMDVCMEVLQKDKPRSIDFEYTLTLSGLSGWASLLAAPLRDEAGEAVGIMITMWDITERKLSEQILAVERERYKTLVDNFQEGVWELDSKGVTTFVNRYFASMLGYSVDEMVGLPYVKFLANPAPGHPHSFSATDPQYLEKRLEIPLRHKNGDPVYALLCPAPIHLADGTLAGALIAATDIQDRRRMEERLRYLSFHDPVTGLYNRTYVEEELGRLRDTSNLPFSIIMGDVNGLKITNDGFGHEKGDELLKQIATIFTACCRDGDTVARVGGDEFVVLLPRTRQTTANSIRKRIQIECSRAQTQTIPPSVSLGVATMTDPTDSFREVMRRAEDNMYRSKLLQSKSVRGTIVAALLRTLAERANETEEHTRRLESLIVAFGEALGRTDEQVNDLVLLAALHDVGKVAVPDSILLKKGPLTEYEWTMMKKHPETGFRIARSMGELAHVSEAILSHHEHWDGSGYPRGLSGEAIPLVARILAIVDAYDAMTSDRPYRAGLSPERALAEIVRRSGAQFDPDLVRVFVSQMAIAAS